MKRRIRTQPTNPFYSNEPAVARSKMADNPAVQNASLGNKTPKSVDKHPGRISGLAGFASKGKPTGKGLNFHPTSPTAKTNFPTQGKLKSSGHPGAHRIGKLKGI